MATTCEQAYQELVAGLSRRGVTAAKMFGQPTIKVGTHSVACLYDEGMAFKLGAGTAEHDKALSLPGAHVFDPSGTGRVIRDWAWIPTEHRERWREFANAAVQRAR